MANSKKDLLADYREDQQKRLDQFREFVMSTIPSKIEETTPETLKATFTDTTDYIETAITPTISGRVSRDGFFHGRLVIEW